MVRCFLECPSTRIWFFFFQIILGLCVLGIKKTEWCVIFITSCQEYILSLWLTTVEVDLDHLAETVLVSQVTTDCEITSFQPLFTVCSMEGSRYEKFCFSAWSSDSLHHCHLKCLWKCRYPDYILTFWIKITEIINLGNWYD